MKNLVLKAPMVATLLSGLFVACTCDVCDDAQRIEISFTESDSFIANPGQGWLCDFSEKTPNIPVGAYYRRFQWADLEPEEGKYNWTPIEHCLANAQKKGLPFCFRIMCASSHSRDAYTSPKWVFEKKGAKCKQYVRKMLNDSNEAIPRYAPYFSDGIFISAHENFIKALAEKYDGDPRIGVIDIGSYGNWGEWHVGAIDVPAASQDVRRKYADMYLDNFKKTLLVFMTDDAQTLKYAIGDGEKSRVGLRRDGVGSPWHEKNWIGSNKYKDIEKMKDVWKSKPIIFEWYYPYDLMKIKKWPLDKAVDFILANHCSLLSDNLKPASISPPETQLVERLGKNLGAKIVAHNAVVSVSGRNVKIDIECENKGSSGIWLPYELKFQLKTPKGFIVNENTAISKPENWQIGKFRISENFIIPQTVINGEYHLSARIKSTGDTFRDFKFATENLNMDGSLPLGIIKIK